MSHAMTRVSVTSLKSHKNVKCITQESHSYVHENPSQKSTLEHQRSNTGTTPSSSNASQLFSKFVSVCSDPSKIEHPLRKRFKFIARVMKDTFEKDAGLGWLSRFNGKPKILRDTVRCLHRKNLDTNTNKLLHRLSACFRDQISSSARMDLFEVETDIMKWTRPFGIPLRIGWHLTRYVRSCFSFLFENINYI